MAQRRSRKRSLATDWLFPRPHATPDDEAAYWPDTCFTVVPDTRWSDQELAAMDDDGARLPADFLEYAALVGHEQTHWIQANAFAYGRFLSRIDHARSEIAESFIGLFTPEQVDTLTRRRLRGDTVLKLAASQRALRRPEFGPIGMVLQRHWWSLGLLRHELETSDRSLAALEASSFRYGLAVLYARAGPFISQVAMQPPPLLREMAMDHAPAGNYSRELSRSAYPELSGIAIAECGAVINQHWTYAHSAELLRRRGDAKGADRILRTHIRSWESKEPTSYGDAFRAFAHFCPELDLNAPRPLHTLAIACCLAMDGNFAPESTTTRPSWLAVAPSLRFLRLCRAVRRVGVVPADVLCDLPAAKTRAYCDDLMAAAGLPETSRHSARHPAQRHESSPINSLRSLLHDAHIESVKLRRAMPAALLAPAETAVHRADELSTGPLKAHDLSRLPPLLSVGGHAAPVGISDARFAECAVAGAYQRLLWQLIADTKPLNFDGLPSDKAGLAAAQRAIALLRERTERPVAMAIEGIDA
jgi:hypothetical protein